MVAEDSKTYVRKTFSDLNKLQKIEGFNFLFSLGIEITNANDWEDEDVWSSVWYHMIPAVSSDREQPTDDGKFKHTMDHSITHQ
jgi:hypothetical protein